MSSSENQDEPTSRPEDPGVGVEVRATLVAAGAWAATAVAPEPAAPIMVALVGLMIVVIGLVVRSWSALFVGSMVASASFAAAAAVAYVPVEAGPFAAMVTVVDDPRPLGTGWAVEVRTDDGARLEARGHGQTGWALAAASVGERWLMEGRAQPPTDRPWLRVRHVVGLVNVHDLEPLDGSQARWAVSEAVRSLVVAGADRLSPERQALYLGLVIGDDRFQADGQRLRFRAAGLAHLLAVSGQNVAFVLAVLAPGIRLLGRRSRVVVSVMALVVFAVVTRMEPSVLRATATATLAVWASTTGRTRSGLTVLAVAVVVLLWVDPFLVDSIGFQLSVAASVGILVLQPAVAGRLPGPAMLRQPLATTIAAQVGVSPVLAGFVGPVSVASVPANLLAGWAAAGVMTSGLTVGVVAGLVGEPLGSVLQWPATAMLWWMDAVASWHARASVPAVGPLGAAAGLALVLARPHHASGRRAPCWLWPVLTVLVGGWLVLAGPRPPSTPGACGTGLVWYPAGSDGRSVLVVEPSADARSVEDCLASGVRSINVVIATDGGAFAAETVTTVADVFDVGLVAAPPQHRIVGAYRQTQPFTVLTGAGSLVVTPTDRGRELDVSMG